MLKFIEVANKVAALSFGFGLFIALMSFISVGYFALAATLLLFAGATFVASELVEWSYYNVRKRG